MKIFIGGLLAGMLLTWASNILFIGWYLKERDEVITDLMAERNQLLERARRWDKHFDETNSGH